MKQLYIYFYIIQIYKRGKRNYKKLYEKRFLQINRDVIKLTSCIKTVTTYNNLIVFIYKPDLSI